MTCPAISACRWVGTKRSRPGDAMSAVTNRHASAIFHGRRITRGCGETRRNTYRIGYVVYQASGRARRRSSQSRQAV